MDAKENINDQVAMEALEPRILMDGNVTAVLTGTTLRITGDGAANAVQIYQPWGDESIRVSGRIHPGTGFGTTINGGAELNLIEGVRSIRINMGNGDVVVGIGDDDFFFPEADTYQRNIIVDLGAGTNRLRFGKNQLGTNTQNVTINGNLTIRGGNGTDTVMMNGTVVGGRFNAILRNGDNQVVFRENAMTLADSEVGRNATIVTGSGNDVIGIDKTRFFGRTVIRTGGAPVQDLVALGAAEGDAEFENLTVLSTDRVWATIGFVGSLIRSRVHGNLLINAGNRVDTDIITVMGATVDGRTTISTGSGDDVVVLTGHDTRHTFFNGRVSVSTGRGNDDLRIAEDGLFFTEGNGVTSARNTYFFGRTMFILGAGDDQVWLGDDPAAGDDDNGDGSTVLGEGRAWFGDRLTINGGAGTDTIENDYFANFYMIPPQYVSIP